MSEADDQTAEPSTSDVTGSGLAAERVRRQEQVDALRRAGREPYPYRFDRTHTVAEAKAHMAAAGIPMRLT